MEWLYKKPKFDRSIHYTAKEMERYIGALNEMHGETVKGIGEGYMATNIRLDRIEYKIDSMGRILESHTEMIGVLMEDVSILKNDVSIRHKVHFSWLVLTLPPLWYMARSANF